MSRIDFKLLATRVKEKEMTFKNLEERTNLSRSTLHNIVHGKSEPTYKVVILIIDALGLSSEDIIAIFFPQVKQEEEIILWVHYTIIWRKQLIQ